VYLQGEAGTEDDDDMEERDEDGEGQYEEDDGQADVEDDEDMGLGSMQVCIFLYQLAQHTFAMTLIMALCS
jgi:hypothetical protein